MLVLVSWGLFSANAPAALVVYPTNPDHRSDGKVSGRLNGTPVTFEYQHTYHVSSEGEKDFKANYVRFAADGPVDVEVTVNASISSAYLRTVGKDLPFTRSGSTLSFSLPGPGNYYLQLPDLNTAGRVTYTVFFFFDDLVAYDGYQSAFAAARNVTGLGVVSHPTLDQTAAVQGILNGRGAVYFPQGIYRTGRLSLPSSTTLYLAPGAVLKGTDAYNSEQYLRINGASNVRIAGLGTIDANGHTPGNMPTKGHGLDIESAAGIVLDDFLFRDTNSWLLHIQRSDNIRFDNLKVFSGKDGIDPDGSRDVLIENSVIVSIDDGFAVKSKFSGRSCERVTMRDCIVFSCASSLKIGTENYFGTVRDIVWDRCDAVDADRACILYTKEDSGTAPVSRITWRNIRVFSFPWQAETGGAPFQFHNVGGASVTELLLENIVAEPRRDCSLYGSVQATFRNVAVNGSSGMPASGMRFAGTIWSNVTSESRPVVFIGPPPGNQTVYYTGDAVDVSVRHPYGKATARVDLRIDDVLAGTLTSGPYRFPLAAVAPGEHTLVATAVDADGSSNTTAPLRVRVATDDRTPSPTPTVTPTQYPCASGTGHTFFEQGGKVTIEAEHYVTSSPRGDPQPWTLSASLPGYLCEGFVGAGNESTGDTTFEAGAELVYRFHIATPGIYEVKLRRLATTGTNDSCYVAFDGIQLGDIYDNSAVGQGEGWTWVSGETFAAPLDAGHHTFHLIRRQKEYRVDRILISSVGVPPDGSHEWGDRESPILWIQGHLEVR